MWQEYLRPSSIEETMQALSAHQGAARIIAGGTDLVLEIQSGECSAACLVDISAIQNLKEIRLQDGYIVIGSAVTHAGVAFDPLILKHAHLLAEAAGEVGSPQIRNIGTIGGNVVNAQPAADTALALLALDAEAEVMSQSGVRYLPLAELYARAGVSKINSSTELVTSFRFKVPGVHTGSAYQRMGKCKSIALPVICAAVVIQLSRGKIKKAAISLGPVAPSPFRALQAEAYLAGQAPCNDTYHKAALIARDEANPRDSLLRCSKVYRENLVEALVKSTLEKAVAAASA
jgi:CO/xanthine dehydrogenase FAD-binding subunit